MLEFLQGRRRWRKIAHLLYGSVVVQSRRPEFYSRFAVCDDIDGRFDLIVLHACLLMRKLKREGRSELSQALFDIMFDDMDENLREMGASDLSVGRKVKTMAKAFFGRLAVYDVALETGSGLDAALLRNLYRGRDPGSVALAAMTAYATRQDHGLASQDIDRLAAGIVAFAAPQEG